MTLFFPPSGPTAWATGDTTLWTAEEESAPDRILVADPPPPGNPYNRSYAGQFTIQSGDPDPLGGVGQQRAEIRKSGFTRGNRQGQESWFAWETYFSPGFPAVAGEFNHFTQWHQNGNPAVADKQPISFFISTLTTPWRFKAWVRGGPESAPSPLTVLDLGGYLDGWHLWVCFVKWAQTGGRLKIWKDNAVAADYTGLVGYNPDSTGATDNIFKQGFFCAPAATTRVLFHAGSRVGDTQADVESRPAPLDEAPWYLNDAEMAIVRYNLGPSGFIWASQAFGNQKVKADAALTTTPTPASGAADYTSSWQTAIYQNGMNDGQMAKAAAIIYEVTGDSRYAYAAKKFCLAWASSYNPLPPANKVGNMMAEPAGPVVKLCIAYELTKAAFTSAEQAQFQAWAAQFVTRAQTNVDSMRDSPGVADVTYDGDTSNVAAWSGNVNWQRAMAVVCAAVVGGTTLQNVLNWNLTHTTPGGRPNGWDAVIDGIYINQTGETFEGRNRQSTGLGIRQATPLQEIANVALHQGFAVDLWNYVTPNGSTLTDWAKYYQPSISSGVPQYPGVDPYGTTAVVGSAAGALAEQAGSYVYHDQLPDQADALASLVGRGGETQRAANFEPEIAMWGAVLAALLGGVPAPPPPPPNIVQEIGGSLLIDAHDGDLGVYQSVPTLTLVSSQVFATLGSVASGAYAFLQLNPASADANAVGISITTSGFRAFRDNASVRTNIGALVPYNGTLHKAFGIREASGTVHFMVGADPGSMADFATATVASLVFAITAMQVRIGGGDGQVVWDNFNTVVASQFTQQGPWSQVEFVDATPTQGPQPGGFSQTGPWTLVRFVNATPAVVVPPPDPPPPDPGEPPSPPPPGSPPILVTEREQRMLRTVPHYYLGG